MKPIYGINKGMSYYTSTYFDGYFRSINIFLNDDAIDFNIKHKDIVSNLKSRLEKVQEEISRYYEDCKSVEEEIDAYRRNESDILSRYDIAKNISKEYTDLLLEHGRAKEN